MGLFDYIQPFMVRCEFCQTDAEVKIEAHESSEGIDGRLLLRHGCKESVKRLRFNLEVPFTFDPVHGAQHNHARTRFIGQQFIDRWEKMQKEHAAQAASPPAGK